MKNSITIEDEENVKEWVRLLRNEADRLQAAVNLGRLGLRTREPTSMVRGTLLKASQARIPGMDFSPAFEALKDRRPEVRCEVAFALGEWADETAVSVLERLAIDVTKDPDTQVRAAVADALGKIGGEQAVKMLQRLAMEDKEEDVRTRAIGVLGSLTAKLDLVRSRGRGSAIRSSGGSHTTPEKIFRWFKEIRNSDASLYVRDVADETLDNLSA